MVGMDNNTYDKRHGGPYDRGRADYCIWGIPTPHYYVGPTKLSPLVTAEQMMPEEIAAYIAGYRAAEDEDWDRKEWR